MTHARRPRLPALTSVRFFAAFHILLFHLWAEKGIMHAPEWFQRFASTGYVAVTFFFVLSGFILVYTYGGRKLDLRRFWRARLARLYPVYLLSLLMTGPFFLYATLKINFPDFAWFRNHLSASLLLVLAMFQAWVPQAALGWNGVGWAVSVEIFFYLSFPVLLGRFSRISNRALAMLCVASWAMALALADTYMLLAPDYFEADPNQYAFWLNALKFNPLVRLPEFLIGLACGLWFLRGGHNPKAASPLVLGGTALALLTTAISPLIPYPVMHTGLYAPAFAAIICGLALRPSWTSLLEFRWLVLLGESSYALFLLHAMIIGMFLFLGTMYGARPLWLVGGVVMAIAVALFVFRFVEEPARRWLRGKPLAQAAGESS